MMQIDTWHFALGIAAMAILTYATRALPFILMKKAKWIGNLWSGRFAILGPALLASTTTVILYAETNKAYQANELLPYVLAVGSVLLILKMSKNIGLAMIVGLTVYGLGLNFL